MKKQIISIIIFLLFSILILTIANFYTKTLIAQSENQKNIDNLKAVIDAYGFIPVIPETLYQAFDSLKNLKGIVFKMWASGYAGIIPLIVGVDLEGKIIKININEKSRKFKETEGLGSRVREKAFTNQFIGKDISQVSLKKDGGEIDAITGATISSRAVCEGIKKGLQIYTQYLTQCEPADPKCQIFPEAKNFIEIIKDTLWYALSYPETTGIVFRGQTFGFLDTIKYIAGLRKNGTIERIIIIYSHETEGIGERIREPEFLDKFKTGIPDAISGATISSQALIKSVQANIEKFNNYLK